jgi:hypothetical protein
VCEVGEVASPGVVAKVRVQEVVSEVEANGMEWVAASVLEEENRAAAKIVRAPMALSLAHTDEPFLPSVNDALLQEQCVHTSEETGGREERPAIVTVVAARLGSQSSLRAGRSR